MLIMVYLYNIQTVLYCIHHILTMTSLLYPLRYLRDQLLQLVMIQIHIMEVSGLVTMEMKEVSELVTMEMRVPLYLLREI